MSASPLELAVPTTAPAPGARNGSSAGPSTGADAQSGQDFAALVAHALGLAHPGAEKTPTAPTTGTGTDPQSGDATPKAGTPAPQSTDTTTPDPATDAPVLTDQAARDAVVAALGLSLVTIPVAVPVPATAPTSGPATTPDAGAEAVTTVATATTAATTAATSPAPTATPVAPTTDPATTSKTDAKTDPKTDPRATATTPAAATTPAVPTDAATQPGTTTTTTTTTVATAAAALAAAAAGANGAAAQDGPQDGPKDGHRDGEAATQDADTSVTPTATSGAGTPTATTDAAAAAVTAPVGDTVQVVASGPVVANPAAQATQAAAGRTHAVHHVSTQVIPEITRLVSDGDGVHRVTLQLNPRALGDVRVVLTMRQGDVHVRLVAGDDARAALASSSSELTRALDQLGLKDHRISLSSLADPSATTWSSGSDQTNDPRQHAQHPGGLDADLQDQKNAQHLWMGDDSTATDGMTPSNSAGRTSRSVPVPTFGATPAGALDVRM